MTLNPVLAIIDLYVTYWLAVRAAKYRYCQTINFITGQYIAAIAVTLFLVVFVGLNQHLIGECHTLYNIEAGQVMQVDQ